MLTAAIAVTKGILKRCDVATERRFAMNTNRYSMLAFLTFNKCEDVREQRRATKRETFNVRFQLVKSYVDRRHVRDMKGVANMMIEIEYTMPLDDEELKSVGATNYTCLDAFTFDGHGYHKDRIDIIIGLIIRDYLPTGAVIERIAINND